MIPLRSPPPTPARHHREDRRTPIEGTAPSRTRACTAATLACVELRSTRWYVTPVAGAGAAGAGARLPDAGDRLDAGAGHAPDTVADKVFDVPPGDVGCGNGHGGVCHRRGRRGGCRRCGDHRQPVEADPNRPLDDRLAAARRPSTRGRDVGGGAPRPSSAPPRPPLRRRPRPQPSPLKRGRPPPCLKRRRVQQPRAEDLQSRPPSPYLELQQQGSGGNLRNGPPQADGWFNERPRHTKQVGAEVVERRTGAGNPPREEPHPVYLVERRAMRRAHLVRLAHDAHGEKGTGPARQQRAPRGRSWATAPPSPTSHSRRQTAPATGSRSALGGRHSRWWSA